MQRSDQRQELIPHLIFILPFYWRARRGRRRTKMQDTRRRTPAAASWSRGAATTRSGPSLHLPPPSACLPRGLCAAAAVQPRVSGGCVGSVHLPARTHGATRGHTACVCGKAKEPQEHAPILSNDRTCCGELTAAERGCHGNERADGVHPRCVPCKINTVAKCRPGSGHRFGTRRLGLSRFGTRRLGLGLSRLCVRVVAWLASPHSRPTRDRGVAESTQSTHTHAHTRTQTHTHAHMHTRTHTHTCTDKHMHTQTRHTAHGTRLYTASDLPLSATLRLPPVLVVPEERSSAARADDALEVGRLTRPGVAARTYKGDIHIHAHIRSTFGRPLTCCQGPSRRGCSHLVATKSRAMSQVVH